MKTRLTPFKPILITALAMVSLAACGGATVSGEDIAYAYIPEELYDAATGDNALKTVIIGAPFGIPQDAFEKTVLASLNGHNAGPPLNLSATANRDDPRNRQVVLAFNPINLRSDSALCSGVAETAPAAGAEGSLQVTGVYCAGGQYLTRATVRSDGVTGPDSQQFQELMTKLAQALFPAVNPSRCIWARQVRMC
jgi:hypothetical protein